MESRLAPLIAAGALAVAVATAGCGGKGNAATQTAAKAKKGIKTFTGVSAKAEAPNHLWGTVKVTITPRPATQKTGKPCDFMSPACL